MQAQQLLLLGIGILQLTVIFRFVALYALHLGLRAQAQRVNVTEDLYEFGSVGRKSTQLLQALCGNAKISFIPFQFRALVTKLCIGLTEVALGRGFGLHRFREPLNKSPVF